MKRKDLLWLLLTTLVVTATITVQTPRTTAQQLTSLSLDPLLIDTRNMKNVDDIFSINVTISNVKELWGYQYSVWYNASVIQVIDYAKLDDRFTKDMPSEIKTNYIAVSRATYDGDLVGITTADPLPVDRLDFVVTGLGTSNLTFSPTYSYLADIHANAFKVSAGNLVVNNGKFSNTQLLDIHDVAVTELSTSITEGKPGDSITITTVVSNHGGFTENVTVTAQYNATMTTKKQIGDTQNIPDLAKNTNKTLTFTWATTTDLKEALYEISVTASIKVDDKISDNVRIVTVKLATTGTGGIPWLYIGIAVVFVVVAVVGVFALRARRK